MRIRRALASPLLPRRPIPKSNCSDIVFPRTMSASAPMFPRIGVILFSAVAPPRNRRDRTSMQARRAGGAGGAFRPLAAAWVSGVGTAVGARFVAPRCGVLSAPVIRGPILGGSGQVSGNFTVADARSRGATARRRIAREARGGDGSIISITAAKIPSKSGHCL